MLPPRPEPSRRHDRARNATGPPQPDPPSAHGAVRSMCRRSEPRYHSDCGGHQRPRIDPVQLPLLSSRRLHPEVNRRTDRPRSRHPAVFERNRLRSRCRADQRTSTERPRRAPLRHQPWSGRRTQRRCATADLRPPRGSMPVGRWQARQLRRPAHRREDSRLSQKERQLRSAPRSMIPLAASLRWRIRSGPRR